MIAKPKLVGAAARQAAEYTDRQWEFLAPLPSFQRISLIKDAHEVTWGKARDLGTSVHEAIEAYAKGEPCEYPKEANPFISHFIEFMIEQRPRFLANEATVWSRKHGYAGTLDAIADIGGDIYLIDFKTGKRLHGEIGMQLSALASADFIITPEGEELELPRAEFLAGLHIRPRGHKLVTVKHRDLNFKAFLACRELYDWSTYVEPSVLGVLV
jgi:hypothetical protein